MELIFLISWVCFLEMSHGRETAFCKPVCFVHHCICAPSNCARVCVIRVPAFVLRVLPIVAKWSSFSLSQPSLWAACAYAFCDISWTIFFFDLPSVRWESCSTYAASDTQNGWESFSLCYTCMYHCWIRFCQEMHAILEEHSCALATPLDQNANHASFDIMACTCSEALKWINTARHSRLIHNSAAQQQRSWLK